MPPSSDRPRLGRRPPSDEGRTPVARRGIFLKGRGTPAESGCVSTLRRRLGRTAGLTTLVGLLCALSASPAAARTFPYLDELMTSQHFAVHYTASTDDTDNDPSTENTFEQQQAGDLLVHAEKAYGALAALGYPAPVDDGDGRVDVFVKDLPDGVFGLAAPDNPLSPQSSGWIVLDPEFGNSVHPIAHELFHVTQLAIWTGGQTWLTEAAAEWSGLRFAGYPAYGLSLFDAPGLSLDCYGPTCGEEGYDQGGYNRWVFVEYLSQRFGAGIVEELFEQARDLGSTDAPLVPLQATLAARGTTLSDAYFDFARQQMVGGYTAPGLQGRQPAAGDVVWTGTATAPLATRSVVVNHLAARFVAFRPALEETVVTTPCYSARLDVTVTLPPGIAAKPLWYWNGPGGAATELAVSGSTASLSVPWYTCSTDFRGLLMLANTSVATDAQEFVVSSSLTVDRSKVTPPPSAPVSTKPPSLAIQGGVVAAPDSSSAPTIKLYGPELTTVTPRSRRVTVVVFANGPGKVELSIGGVGLGTHEVRPGYNRMRVTVPQAQLRRAPGGKLRPGRLQLAITSVSPSGGRGMTLRRALRVKR